MESGILFKGKWDLIQRNKKNRTAGSYSVFDSRFSIYLWGFIYVIYVILFSGIDKKRDLINLFWDPIQWISCLKQ